MEEISSPALSKSSQEFRKYFLLLFTKELIKQTKVEEFFTLKNVLKKKDKKIEDLKKEIEDEELTSKTRTLPAVAINQQQTQKRVVQGESFMPSMMYTEKPLVPLIKQYAKSLPQSPTLVPRPQMQVPGQNQINQQRPQIQQPRVKPPLVIPEYPLPQTVQYLRPYPTNAQIDLGKLNPLISDPAVMAIECNGTEEPLIVRGAMGAKNTSIILNEEEVKEVLQKFSEASRIPIHDGIYKIIVGKLILSAIVSEVVGSKFIVRKMAPPSPYGMPNMSGMSGMSGMMPGMF